GAICELRRRELALDAFGERGEVGSAARQSANGFDVHGVHSKLIQRSRNGARKARTFRNRSEVGELLFGGKQMNRARRQGFERQAGCGNSIISSQDRSRQSGSKAV